MVYFVTMFLILFLSARYDGTGKGMPKWIVALVYFVLVATAGMRYRIGLDTIRYEMHYSIASSIFDVSWNDLVSAEFSPLYMLLQGVAKSISDEFYVLQFIQAIIVNLAVFRFLRYNASNFFFALFFYYILEYHNFCFEVMREALAVSMFLFSWEYYKNNRWIPYYIFAVLGLGFHHSALLLFILPILKLPGIASFIKIDKKLAAFSILLIILGFTFQGQLFSIFSSINFQESVSERIQGYTSSNYGSQTLNIFGILTAVLLKVLYPLYVFNKTPSTEKNTQLNECMIFLFISFSVLSIPITIFYRLTNYVYLFVIVLYSNYITKQSAFSQCTINSRKKIIFLPLIILVIWGFLGAEGPKHVYNRYFPYSNIINKETDYDREVLFNFYSL